MMSEKSLAADKDGHGAFLPIGSIVMWGGLDGALPRGWLLCDGKSYPKAKYPELASVVLTHFGEPRSPDRDFYVPDLRGRFVRGVDSGAARDPDSMERKDMRSDRTVGGVVGSVQSDEFREHVHTYQHPAKREGGGLYEGRHWWPGEDATGKAGGKETRPINAYLYFIIKAE